MKRLTLLSLTYWLGLVACEGAPAEENADLEPTAQPLLGTYEFTECADDPALSAGVRTAIARGRAVATSPAFEQCVIDAVLTTHIRCNADPFQDQPIGVLAQRAVQAARTPGTVSMDCTGERLGHTIANADIGTYGQSHDHFSWNRAGLANAVELRDFAGIADTIWHEAMHQQSFRDSPSACGYTEAQKRTAISYLVGGCMAKVLSTSQSECSSCPAGFTAVVDAWPSPGTCSCFPDPLTRENDEWDDAYYFEPWKVWTFIKGGQAFTRTVDSSTWGYANLYEAWSQPNAPFAPTEPKTRIDAAWSIGPSVAIVRNTRAHMWDGRTGAWSIVDLKHPASRWTELNAPFGPGQPKTPIDAAYFHPAANAVVIVRGNKMYVFNVATASWTSAPAGATHAAWHGPHANVVSVVVNDQVSTFVDGTWVGPATISSEPFFSQGPGAPYALGPGPNEVTICSDPNFSGRCTTIGLGFHKSLSAIGFNDVISSFKTGANVRLTLCEHQAWGGRCETFGAGEFVAVTSKTRIGNDTASSARVVAKSTPRCDTLAPPPAGFVFFYDRNTFAGDCVALPPGRYNTEQAMGIRNDSISSLWMGPGIGEVKIFSDSNPPPSTKSFQSFVGNGTRREVLALSPFNFENRTSAIEISP